MNNLSYVKKAIITAACIALCVVLPTAFHAIPNAGSILSPMHIPVLLCGMICGWPMGLLCGIAGPVMSSLITQMPSFAYLPSMLVELAVYGLITGLAMKTVTATKVEFTESNRWCLTGIHFPPSFKEKKIGNAKIKVRDKLF